MATLSEDDRQKIWRGLMSYWSNLWEGTNFSAQDLKSAVDATDQWIDDNQISFNQALPSSVQTGMTQTQKTLMFCSVAMARVSIEFLRKIFGRID